MNSAESVPTWCVFDVAAKEKEITEMEAAIVAPNF
jgi:hypothetical protein